MVKCMILNMSLQQYVWALNPSCVIKYMSDIRHLVFLETGDGDNVLGYCLPEVLVGPS